MNYWREVASEHLADMRTSLEGALLDEEKLRELFDKIDLDAGGTIDKKELEAAIGVAGKHLTPEQVDAMLHAADEDFNGEIDFSEFVDIIRGHVKATEAAKVITRSFRKRKTGRAAQLGKSVLGVATSAKISDLSTLEMNRLLGGALLSQKASLKELVRDWDKHKTGEITRMAFRTGVRDDLGLHNLNGSFIDGWFDSIDADKGGTLDLGELREALAAVEEQVRQERVEAAVKQEELRRLSAHIRAVEAAITIVREAMQPALAGAASLAAHRALPHIDARVGERLQTRIKTEGVNERMVVNDWDLHRLNAGSLWMECDEFASLVADVLAECGAFAKKVDKKKGPSAGSVPASGAAKGGSSKAKDSAVVVRPTNPLGQKRTSGAGESVDTDGKRKLTRDEQAEAERAKGVTRERLSALRIDESQVEALFVDKYLRQFAAAGQSVGRVWIQPVVQDLLAAAMQYRAKDDELARQVINFKRHGTDALEQLQEVLAATYTEGAPAGTSPGEKTSETLAIAPIDGDQADHQAGEQQLKAEAMPPASAAKAVIGAAELADASDIQVAMEVVEQVVS